MAITVVNTVRTMSNGFGTASYARTGTAFIIESHHMFTIVPTVGLELNVQTGIPSARTLGEALAAFGQMANEQDVDNYVLFDFREDAEVYAEDLEAQSKAAQRKFYRGR